MMPRQYGADLFLGTRVTKRNTRRKKSSNLIYHPRQEEEEDDDSVSSIIRESSGTFATLKDWQAGITGRIQVSVKLKEVDEEEQEDEVQGSREAPGNSATALSPLQMRDSVDCETETNSTMANHENLHISEKLPSPRPSPTLKSSRYIRKRTLLCLEVEKCIALKSTIPKLSGMNPIILVRLNGKEIGRTPALKNTTSPIWYDEVFEFPVCRECKVLSLEVWDVSPGRNDFKHEWNFIGQCAIELSDMMQNTVISDNRFTTHVLELKKWRNMELDKLCEDKPSCPCPSIVKESDEDDHDASSEELQNHLESPRRDRSKTIRINRPTGLVSSLRRKRLNSITLVKPDGATSLSSIFKVENPDPFRRKDIREFKESRRNDPFYASTSFRALSLITIYMSIGVVGFSCVFEDFTPLNSLYFSVVTFTTVGYGDVKPLSQNAKLFSCFFAFMGIGIIGIALGYLGQNLIQAQVIALQKRPESDETDDSVRSTGERVIHRSLMSRSNLLFLKVIGVVKAIFPLAAIVGLGSVVVGNIEGWSWVDSIYWCIMTGTSVGYGDLYPTTQVTIIFTIFFVPVSVAIFSAFLGRIANIFVEREISKANTKLLKREVTLEDLQAMNADGDGDVSPLEFVEHMLLVMNKVDQRLLDELHAQFERLDADGSGGLQKDDLDILTERKLSENRDRALNEYHQTLFREDNLYLSGPQIVPSG